jgi:hypothetical protein
VNFEEQAEKTWVVLSSIQNNGRKRLRVPPLWLDIYQCMLFREALSKIISLSLGGSVKHILQLLRRNWYKHHSFYQGDSIHSRNTAIGLLQREKAKKKLLVMWLLYHRVPTERVTVNLLPKLTVSACCAKAISRLIQPDRLLHQITLLI